ncbi:MAG TPA: DUF4439 domain-containing protein [Propionibacteriaceae bacterium]|nr:DUF4439 domain-containing protein [Propionibacteriaceae bacterium]
MQSLSRRAALGIAVVGVAGCTGTGRLAPAPTPGATGTRPAPSPSPTPDADLVLAAGQEADGGWYAALAKQATALKAPATFAPWCLAAAATRTTHASLLSRRDPLSGENGDPAPWFTPSPTPPAMPATHAAALAAITRRESALSQAQLTRALATDDPTMVMLWASLATSAHARRRPGPLPSTVAVTPSPIQAPDRTEALGLLHSHIHVLVAGMELGLGILPIRDPRYTPGRARLSVVEATRDAVTARIRSQQGSPAPPLLGYQLPPMTTPATILKAWGTLEVGVLGGWAAVASASTGADREQAIEAMFAQADVAAGYGVGLGPWPGWV